jgi:hypothetical protein
MAMQGKNRQKFAAFLQKMTRAVMPAHDFPCSLKNIPGGIHAKKWLKYHMRGAF